LFPGGKRNTDENSIQTAYREFLEEIFNVVVDINIVNEIIDTIISKKDMYPIDSKFSNNATIPSYTFLQSSKVITIFINMLLKYNIKSDVFPFGYNGLFNNKGEVNIFNFCSQRRYITEIALPEKNELVFITMIPLNNLLFSVTKHSLQKEIYHYHGENLKIHVHSSIKHIKSFIDKLKIDQNQLSTNLITISII